MPGTSKQSAAAIVRSLATKRWTADEARRVLSLWQASRKSARAFAREHGLDAQRISWWKKRLGVSASSDVRNVEPAAALVPAIVRGADDGARVRVRLPAGVVIEASSTDDVAPEWVAAVMRELADG